MYGNARKMTYFAQAMANRMGIAHTPGALMGLGVITATGGKCPAGTYLSTATGSGNQYCLDAGGAAGSALPGSGGGTYKIADTTNPATGEPWTASFTSGARGWLDQAGDAFNSLFASTTGSARGTAYDPGAAARLAGKKPNLEPIAAFGLLLGVAGLAYGIYKKKPGIAIGAIAAGAALVVGPKLLGGGTNPFAGARADARDDRGGVYGFGRASASDPDPSILYGFGRASASDPDPSILYGFGRASNEPGANDDAI